MGRMQLPSILAVTEILGIDVHPWKIVGLSGAAIFGVRFVIQWIASERAKKSVIPFGFWECSALGSILMLSYFAIYQRDPVGVLSSFLPLPIYLRNLYFRYTQRTSAHAGNRERPRNRQRARYMARTTRCVICSRRRINFRWRGSPPCATLRAPFFKL